MRRTHHPVRNNTRQQLKQQAPLPSDPTTYPDHTAPSTPRVNSRAPLPATVPPPAGRWELRITTDESDEYENPDYDEEFGTEIDVETIMLSSDSQNVQTQSPVDDLPPAYQRESNPTQTQFQARNNLLALQCPQQYYQQFNNVAPRAMNRWEYKVWQVEQLSKHQDPQDDPERFDPKAYLEHISQFTFDGLMIGGSSGGVGKGAGGTSMSSTVRDSELSAYRSPGRGGKDRSPAVGKAGQMKELAEEDVVLLEKSSAVERESVS